MSTSALEPFIWWQGFLILTAHTNLFLATSPTSHKNQKSTVCGLSSRSWVFSYSCSVFASVVPRRLPEVLETGRAVSFPELLLQWINPPVEV